MRTNYRINSGVRFEMLSQDQLQELFDGVLHRAGVHRPGRVPRRSPGHPERSRRLGGWPAGAHPLLPGQALAGPGTAQLHHLCPRWQSQAQHPHRPRPGALWPWPHLPQLYRRRDAGAPALRQDRCAHRGQGRAMPCPTSTSASRWAPSATCTTSWAPSTSSPACSPTPASPSSPGPTTL